MQQRFPWFYQLMLKTLYGYHNSGLLKPSISLPILSTLSMCPAIRCRALVAHIVCLSRMNLFLYKFISGTISFISTDECQRLRFKCYSRSWIRLDTTAYCRRNVFCQGSVSVYYDVIHLQMRQPKYCGCNVTAMPSSRVIFNEVRVYYSVVVDDVVVQEGNALVKSGPVFKNNSSFNLRLQFSYD